MVHLLDVAMQLEYRKLHFINPHLFALKGVIRKKNTIHSLRTIKDFILPASFRNRCFQDVILLQVC